MVGQTEAIGGGQVHYCPDMLWMLYPWSVQGQAEQPHLVSGTPAHDRGVGTKWSLRFLPIQTILWFYYVSLLLREFIVLFRNNPMKLHEFHSYIESLVLRSDQSSWSVLQSLFSHKSLFLFKGCRNTWSTYTHIYDANVTVGQHKILNFYLVSTASSDKTRQPCLLCLLDTPDPVQTGSAINDLILNYISWFQLSQRVEKH